MGGRGLGRRRGVGWGNKLMSGARYRLWLQPEQSMTALNGVHVGEVWGGVYQVDEGVVGLGLAGDNVLIRCRGWGEGFRG